MIIVELYFKYVQEEWLFLKRFSFTLYYYSQEIFIILIIFQSAIYNSLWRDFIGTTVENGKYTNSFTDTQRFCFVLGNKNQYFVGSLE